MSSVNSQKLVDKNYLKIAYDHLKKAEDNLDAALRNAATAHNTELAVSIQRVQFLVTGIIKEN